MTHISLDFLIVKSKLCRNESSAREGIDTSIYCVQLFDHFSVEMSHQPERALTLFHELVMYIAAVRRNESSAREGIDTSIYCVQLFDHFSVEMSHQPERALTLFHELVMYIAAVRRNESSAREGIDTIDSKWHDPFALLM